MFLWKVSLKILKSGLILKTLTHASGMTFWYIHIPKMINYFNSLHARQFFMLLLSSADFF